MVKFLSIRKRADSLLAAATGFLIISLFTGHSGIGVAPDSVVLFTSAENFRATGKLTDFSHTPLVEFPAFYPIFLSGIIALTGLTPLAFAPFLNALLFAVVIYLSGYIMEHFSQRSKWYKRAVLSCIVLSPALLEVYSMLWSETLFILWLLLFVIVMHMYFQSYSRKLLIAAAVIASLASITRYAGITIIGTGSILLVLDMTLPFLKKLVNILLYAAISPLLLIINLARNNISGGTITGNREKSITTLWQNMQDAGTVFYSWLPFLNGENKGAGLLAIILIILLLFACLRQFFYKRRLSGYENIALTFSLVYILFMTITASVSRFETLSSRLLSPVFIVLIWSCSSWIIRASAGTNYLKRKWIMITAFAVFLIFQYGQLSADYETWDGVKDAGIPGYTEDQWKYAETVLFIQKNQALFKNNYTIYSNANDAIYFFTGRQGKFLPGKEYSKGVTEFLSDPHCYVVFFDDGDNPELVDRNFIVNIKKMKLLKQFNDGAIYEYDEKPATGNGVN